MAVAYEDRFGKVSVMAYGATGDGVADDTTEIQNALNSGAAIVVLPAGTYAISSTLSVPPGVQMHGSGIDATTIQTSGQITMVECAGTATNWGAVSSVIFKGDPSFTLSSAPSTMQHFDAVFLSDNRDFSFNNERSTFREGGGFTVAWVDGNDVYFDSSSHIDLPATRLAGGTASNVKCWSPDREGTTIKDMTLKGPTFGLVPGPTQTSYRGVGIRLRDVSNSLIERVKIVGTAQFNIELDRCARTRVDKVLCHNLMGKWDSGSGQYAIIMRGCYNTTVTDSDFWSGRHGVDVDNGSGTDAISGVSDQQMGNDTLFSNCFIATSDDWAPTNPSSTEGQSAVSTHEPVRRVKFSNCVVKGGTNLRGSEIHMDHCTVTLGNTTHGRELLTCSYGAPLVDYRITNCSLEYWKSSNSGDPGVIQISKDWALNHVLDEGGIIMITNNVMRNYCSTSQPMIGIVASGELNDPTTIGDILIANNMVYAEGTNRPFVSITGQSSTIFGTVTVKSNVIAGSVTSLGTITQANTVNSTEWNS